MGSRESSHAKNRTSVGEEEVGFGGRFQQVDRRGQEWKREEVAVAQVSGTQRTVLQAGVCQHWDLSTDKLRQNQGPGVGHLPTC